MSQEQGFFGKLKKALLGQSPDKPASKSQKTASISQEVDVRFAENFTQDGGHFIFCESNAELSENLKRLMQEKSWSVLFAEDEHLKRILRQGHVEHKNLLGLEDCQARLTPCEGLVANEGAIMMSARTDKGRLLAACPRAHLIVGYTSQLAFTREAAVEQLKSLSQGKLLSNFTFLYGPDHQKPEEKDLEQVGLTQPAELYLFLVED